MAPAVEPRDQSRRHFPEPSVSPVRDRRRSPHRKEIERGTQREMERSPRKKPNQTHRKRSPSRNRSRSPHGKGSSRSPSPRTKRLRRAQAEREADKAGDRERERIAGREEREKDRHRERGEGKDGVGERRAEREKDDGGLSRSSRHGRSVSPQERGHRSRRSSRSPSRASKSGGREEGSKSRTIGNPKGGDNDPIAKMKAAEEALEAKNKQKPSFELSGKLAEETNRVRGVTLLFTEPPEAHKPATRWRLYVFKSGEVLNEPLYIHRQSCYLFGRERRVADIPTDHPSCSKQHAVIQYRLVEKEQPDGLLSKQVRPYLMDLGSTNGTFINDNRIEPQRYYELIEKDTIRFGNSSREYVILHEDSVE